MLIVREIFHLHFGKFRDAKTLLDEGMQNNLLHLPGGSRILTDFTGEGYRFIMELPCETLAEYETTLQKELSTPGWRDWYVKFMPLVRFSEREILKLIM